MGEDHSREALIAALAADDVIGGAIAIAQAHDPELEAEEIRDELAELAHGARRLAENAVPARTRLDRLIEHMFRTLAFLGNEADYDDPRNSLLPDVLERRLGLPITLATIFVELGRALDLDVHGISFPGRFLAGCVIEGETHTVDCFTGQLVDRDGCRALLAQIQGRHLDLEPWMLAPASTEATLARMLANLQGVYIQRRDLERSLVVTDLGLAIQPHDARLYRNRGLIRYSQGDLAMAIIDLEHYLELEPDAADRAIIEHHLHRARRSE